MQFDFCCVPYFQRSSKVEYDKQNLKEKQLLAETNFKILKIGATEWEKIPNSFFYYQEKPESPQVCPGPNY
jgi:hypothetical protein